MRGNRLYIGNLSYSVTTEQLQELFSDYGEVREVKLIDGKGFGFVEMSNSSEAESAKESLDGIDFEGNVLKVDEAHPQRKRRNRGDRKGYRKLELY